MIYVSPKYEMDQINASDVITGSLFSDGNTITDGNKWGDWVNSAGEALDQAAGNN